MSRGSGLCGLCGGVKRGRGARVAAPVADCCVCNKPICQKHSAWSSEDEAYICTKCARDSGRKVVKL